jgi:D-glycero-alpha-D-manno-heptose-7-phosphate kinase
MDFSHGLIVHHDADLPARSGLGSSSSFTVGLLHNLYSKKGVFVGKEQLAREAIHFEQNVLKETVGSQDQVAAAYGGFNRIDFTPDENFIITPMTLGQERLNHFQDHFVLFYTGIQRFASDVEKEKVKNIPSMGKELHEIKDMVDEAVSILGSDGDLDPFGKLLHSYWENKKKLNAKSSSSHIDAIYDRAMKAGALGGKILGAGSGGFILFFIQPERRHLIVDELNDLLHVPFRFENGGSQVIYFNEISGEEL